MQTISTIAREISHDWKNVNYAAKPYLQAMRSLDSASDSFGYDSAKSVVSYFLANASGYRGDWYPSTLIRESYFEEYMDQLVYDCYEMPKDLPSFMTIVLDYVALKQDYTTVEIDGVTYFYR